MIQANNLVKKFGDFTALDGLNIHVPKGAIYGLVGPNGAGKSTLIRHLCGVYKQDSGEILIAGKPVFEKAENKTSFVCIPDEVFFYTQDNTLDLMKLYKGLYPSFDENLFYELTKYFPTIDLKKNIRSFSKGMQKQVAFMLSISCKADVLILDEPVDGLDPVMRRQVWSIIMADVAERELTVLISSHNLRELEDVCDHVGIMSKGKVLIERSLDELQTSISKIQVAYEETDAKLPEDLDILNDTVNGRVHMVIVHGDPDTVKKRFEETNPLLIDVVPLSLEEIFIYELGGEDYEVKDITF